MDPVDRFRKMVPELQKFDRAMQGGKHVMRDGSLIDPMQESDPTPYFEMIVEANPTELAPGVIFDHGSRTTEELALDVIRLAFAKGWQDSHAAELLDCPRTTVPESWAEIGYMRSAEGYANAVADAAFDAGESAMDYLQELVPEGHYLSNDGEAGAFGVWPIEDGE